MMENVSKLGMTASSWVAPRQGMEPRYCQRGELIEDGIMS
jgi:hypothetical protein